MSITITAFEDSPDRGRGLARDMRVRWALEELGLAYDVRPLSFEEMKRPDYLALQPFGQIPSYVDDGLVLFESGAIVQHLAQSRPGLFPVDPNARARAVAWMFAALNTVEPPVFEWSMAMVLEREKPWHADRLSMLEGRVHDRLQQLSAWLGESEWLEGAFSAADLLMVTVLSRLGNSHLLAEWANLTAYVSRGVARPAYRRAFADQLAVFEAASARKRS